MFNRILLRTAQALALLVCVAARPAFAESLVFPPGSHIGLTPPAGFEAVAAVRGNPNVHGFEDRTNQAAISLLELPAQVYAELEKATTAEALKKQGVTVEKREPLSLKDGKAVLLLGQQTTEKVNVRKWILVASMPELTALLTVEIPSAAQAQYSDEVIHAALASLTVRTTVPVEEQIGMLPYRLGDLAGFRVVRVVGGNLVMLTEGPKDAMDAVEQPHVLVTIGAGGPEDATSRQNFARNLLMAIPGFKDVRLTGSEMLRLNGQQVYELMADAKDPKSEAELKIVQWLRFGGNGYMHIVATAPRDGWSQAFPRFRAIRDGIGGRSN
jgi:hypothetical protein